MQTEIVVRDAGENDIPAILDIYNDAILHTTAVYDYRPHSLEMRVSWFGDKRVAGLPVLVAEYQKKVAGFASYGPFRSWAAYKYTAEHAVYVSPQHRKKGIGKVLLQAIMDSARKNGMHVMVAGIDRENPASINMHRKLGFSEAGVIRQVAYKFGSWRDLVLMQHIFPEQINPSED